LVKPPNRKFPKFIQGVVMPITQAVRHSLIVLILAAQGAAAHTRFCEERLGSPRPLTAPMLRVMSTEHVERNLQLAPAPGFDNIEIQSRIEQVGEQGPLALQQHMGLDMSFVSTPAPTSPDVATIGLLDEAASLPVHLDTRVNGQRRSTTVYASLPHPVAGSPGQFLVGPQYSTVVVFLHGGGTPTATGKNGVTPGEKLAAQNIPMIAPDMPGHGRATRNPDGLMSFQEQADWLLQVLDHTIHPSVKIVLVGHSWGGEFVTFLHRLSADPKYARIAHYIALSPPVDTSVGQGAAKRIEHEQWFQRNFHTPEIKGKIAPTDFEFLSNILKHGKNSDVGGVFTGLTNLDYSTPPLTVEEQKRLKPLTVVVGEADGLVYVGREQQFEQVFGNLQQPSRFIKLGPGRTFESEKTGKLYPTGHGVFEVFGEGTTTPYVYSLIADIARQVGVGDNQVKPDKNLALVDQAYRAYANFIAFREMLIHDVGFVETPTSKLSLLSDRKRKLDEASKALNDRRIKGAKEVEAKVQQAIQVLRERLGIKDPISLDRAREELTRPPLSDARKVELENYIKQIDDAEARLRVEFHDAQSDAELEKLRVEFAKVMTELKIEKLEDYEPHLKTLNAIKKPTKEETLQRADVARLSQKFLAIQKTRGAQFGVERDRRLRNIKLPAGVQDHRMALRELRSDQSPERMEKLRAFVAEVPALEQAARAAAEAEQSAQLAAIFKSVAVSSEEEFERTKTEADARMSFTYVPPQAPDLLPVAHRLRDLQE
jgi:pimeloyl-ACP methyl ester carboxylesterase